MTLKERFDSMKNDFEFYLMQVRVYLHHKFFPKESRYISTLIGNNEELERICTEQIDQIRELEDKIHHLDFQLEDEEIKNEQLETDIDSYKEDIRVLEREKDYMEEEHEDEVRSLRWELEDLQDENGRLQDEIYDLQYELQNREEF